MLSSVLVWRRAGDQYVRGPSVQDSFFPQPIVTLSILNYLIGSQRINDDNLSLAARCQHILPHHCNGEITISERLQLHPGWTEPAGPIGEAEMLGSRQIALLPLVTVQCLELSLAYSLTANSPYRFLSYSSMFGRTGSGKISLAR
jgi:hypothetical protein